MKTQLMLILFISILIIPVSIQAQEKNTSEDPLIGEQWALNKIGFDNVGLSEQKAQNKIQGKNLNVADGQFLYEEGKSFSADYFKINLEESKIRRLSIELANPQGKWALEVRDSSNHILGQNTSSYKRIDVLLPKNQVFSELKISLKRADGDWGELPIIKNLSGVNSSIVAVIDSGVIEHEDFCDNILYSLGKDFREGMDLPNDTNGHGTHITGIIAACNHNGIGLTGAIGGSEVDVIPLKVLGENGLTDDDALASAVETAIDYEVDVINLSIAGKGSTEMFENKVRDALLTGIPVVAAAGNGNELTEDVYPGNFPGVITVSGVDQTGNKVKRSNFGWEVDISAPGIDILSTYLTPSYTKLSGTSMAAPYVTSVIAYYKKLNPGLDFVQINRLLANNALDVGVKGYDIYTGAGIVQFSNSIEGIEKIDWLNLKDGQPVEKKSKIVLGFSRELIGKKLLLFKDGRIFKQLSIDKMIEEVPIEDSVFTLHDNKLVAIAVDDSNNVLDFSKISLENSNIVVISNEFTDIPKTHWAYKEVLQAKSWNVINGYPNGNFKPSENITRRQSVMMINRLMANGVAADVLTRLERPSFIEKDRLFNAGIPELMTIPFKDVGLNTAGIVEIVSGYENGYVNGSKGYFYPERKLTRAQMALILSRAMKWNTGDNKSSNFFYLDVPKNAEYYSAVQLLSEKGILTKQDYFRPNEPITRAQFAAMLVRTMKLTKQH